MIVAKAARLLREYHELKAPQERGKSNEETEAIPVESEPAVAGINLNSINLTIKGESKRLLKNNNSK